MLPAKHGASVLEPGGSIVFISGVAAYRPGPHASLLVAINGSQASLAAMADRFPDGRTQDIAAAIIALLRNGFITGTVLHADGGHRLV
jgi:NAD(P)-dependent dehydrogenase (short-subunit alcohol dehydrogenase family)